MYSFPFHEAIITPEGVRCQVEIPGDCPFFAGHFPDNPVLPAIAHIYLVTEVYRRASVPGAFLSRIDQLRLSAPIGADEIVSVHVTNPGPDAKSRFTIERGGNIVSQGSVAWSGG